MNNVVFGISEGADPDRSGLIHIELHQRTAVKKIGRHLPAILDDGFRKRLALYVDRRMALAGTLYGRFDFGN